MANDEDLARLRQGAAVWNAWRAQNPERRVDLSGSKLGDADLSGADLREADLSGADLPESQVPGRQRLAFRLTRIAARGG